MSGSIFTRPNASIFNDEDKVLSAELAGARGHTGGAAHGTRGEDGAFGP